MHEVFLLLGTNLGNRIAQLQKAVDLLEKRAGNIIKCSDIYWSEAWGIEDQPDFLNQVIIIQTSLESHVLLDCLIDIESEMGRKRIIKWGERCIDIDILYYDNQVMNTDRLKIPHPEIGNRRFTLVPLCELAPEMEHPLNKKSHRQMLQECTDRLAVKTFAVVHSGNIFCLQTSG